MEPHKTDVGELVVIDVAPQANASGAPSMLRESLRVALDQGYRCLLLNVTDLSHVDSLWLGALVQGYVSAIRRGGVVKLLRPPRRLRELLRVTKLDRVLEVFESEEAARASLQAADHKRPA
jgi:anti-sigma B factor antagonist